MSKPNDPTIGRNEQQLAELRVGIIEAENEMAAGLDVDITDVDPLTYARELLEEGERLGIEPAEPPAPERTR